MTLTRKPGRELLVLHLGPVRFGAWIDDVLEIVRTPPISRLPLAHPEVVGVTSVRGDVVPVLDLGARLLGAPSARPGRLILIRHQESGTVVGLLVDAADLMVDVSDDEIQAPPAPAEARLPAELVTGVVSRDEGVVTVLHIERAAAPPLPAPDER